MQAAVLRAWHACAHAKYAPVQEIRAAHERRRRCSLLRAWRSAAMASRSARVDAERWEAEKVSVHIVYGLRVSLCCIRLCTRVQLVRAATHHSRQICRRVFERWRLGVRAVREGSLVRAGEAARRALIQRVLHKLEAPVDQRVLPKLEAHVDLRSGACPPPKVDAPPVGSAAPPLPEPESVGSGAATSAASAAVAASAEPSVPPLATRVSAVSQATPWDAPTSAPASAANASRSSGPRSIAPPISCAPALAQQAEARAARRADLRATVQQRRDAAADASAAADDAAARAAAEKAAAEAVAAAAAAAQREHWRQSRLRAELTAAAHHELRLMRTRVWLPLVDNARAAREKLRAAALHDARRSLRGAFGQWRDGASATALESRRTAAALASQLHARVARSALAVWGLALASRRRRLWRIAAAQRARLAVSALRAWRHAAVVRQVRREELRAEREAAAEARGRRTTLRHAWAAWLRALPVLREEAAAEVRRRALWARAVEVLESVGAV